MFSIKSKITEPVSIDIRSDDTNPSFQQGLLLKQKYAVLQMIDRANDGLDRKGGNFLQAGGLIAALMGVLSIPGVIDSDAVPIARIGTVVVLTFLAIMIFLSLKATSPREYYAPGSLDLEKMNAEYLNKAPDDCFTQILKDVTGTIRLIRDLNSDKTKWITWSGRLLILEILSLAVTILVITFLANYL